MRAPDRKSDGLQRRLADYACALTYDALPPSTVHAAKVRVIDNRIEDVALSVAPVAPTPFRCKHTEAFLSGKSAASESIEAAVAVLLSECKPRTSPHRATAEYRKEVLPVLLRRTLGKAIERAKTGEVVPEIYRVE